MPDQRERWTMPSNQCLGERFSAKSLPEAIKLLDEVEPTIRALEARAEYFEGRFESVCKMLDESGGQVICLSVENAALRERVEKLEAEETGWLVEFACSEGGAPRFWSGSGWSGLNDAIRFSRKLDAERIIESMSLDAIATEHMWLAATRSPEGEDLSDEEKRACFERDLDEDQMPGGFP